VGGSHEWVSTTTGDQSARRGDPGRDLRRPRDRDRAAATWIDSITGLGPDAGSGSVEWAIVALFAVAALGAAVIARHDYRNLTAAR
jgi:hypothetical protein